MGAEKRICFGIMICQMTAILSGCALMYLSVIVVIPSLNELEFKFYDDPIMCTTVKATDIAAGGKKVDCVWATCNEWCLSKTSSPCMQIYVLPRREGDSVTVDECEIVANESCSALNVTLTQVRLCKKGECKDISGLFNCSKGGENECRDISAGYDCTGGSFRNVNKTSIVCNEEKCDSRLNGVYLCLEGECRKIEDKTSYLDCERKCENLNMNGKNTIIFSKDRLISGKCNFINSTNELMVNVNNNNNWRSGNEYLYIFCSLVENQNSGFQMKDCFNATLRNKREVSHIKSYLKLIDMQTNPPPSIPWLLNPEESLRIMNDTKLKINPDGCVNTLRKECQSFFLTHATDGRDGRTTDRYPCFYTNSTSSFVIGKYDPKSTYMFLLLASIVPAILFVGACFCLYFCSKSISVDDGGRLKVTLLSKGGATAGNASEL